MSLFGPKLTILVGPTAPLPAPPTMMEAFESVDVTQSDAGRSGFQISLRVGRGPLDLLDYSLLTTPLLRPFSRVIIVVTVNSVPEVLMDGIITNQQLSPSSEGTLLTLTGEDVSVMMDLEEKSVEHPAQNEMVIALKIIASYAQFGLIPMVIPPPTLDIPLPTERTPVQQGTDLAYLEDMASRFGYIFCIEPGPVPLMNTAYWGPPPRLGVPQRALSMDLGPNTNVEAISFQYDGLGPTMVTGQIQDRNLNEVMPVQTFASTRAPLSSQPAWLTQTRTRTQQFREPGLNTMQAFARAQGETDASVDRALTATGTVDALEYDGILKARGLVGVRGVGFSYDGMYYIKRVTHSIRRGEYKQQFTLARDGLGALLPVVVP